jgi:hypothetical protein
MIRKQTNLPIFNMPDCGPPKPDILSPESTIALAEVH